MDIQTVFVGLDQGADYAIGQLGLAEDDGLETAVVLSLFTDRRAEADDIIPDGSDDRRGWWADTQAEIGGDRMGSRLWLLSREKQLQSVVQRAREYAEESLAWLVEDGVAESVSVAARIVRRGILGLEVSITRTLSPPAKFRFEHFWGGA